MPIILPLSSCEGRIVERISSTTREPFSSTTPEVTMKPKPRIPR